MICSNCRQAGDTNKKVRETELPERDYRANVSKMKLLHLQCLDKGCFCQHRINK